MTTDNGYPQIMKGMVKMKVLLIGGTGTISSAITRLLVKKGHEVYILNRGTRNDTLPEGVKTICADINNEAEAAEKLAKEVQDLFMTDYFRVYVNTDIAGVEYGGSLKNVIALCAGMLDGMGYGDNAKAALVTRGMTEIARLGVRLGAKEETFFGLSGIGDLIVTCTSSHSRNHRAGELIGKGMSPKQAIDTVKMVVEGIPAAVAGYNLSKKVGVELPIIHAAYRILKENADVKQEVLDLMTRPAKPEH